MFLINRHGNMCSYDVNHWFKKAVYKCTWITQIRMQVLQITAFRGFGKKLKKTKTNAHISQIYTSNFPLEVCLCPLAYSCPKYFWAEAPSSTLDSRGPSDRRRQSVRCRSRKHHRRRRSLLPTTTTTTTTTTRKKTTTKGTATMEKIASSRGQWNPIEF